MAPLGIKKSHAGTVRWELGGKFVAEKNGVFLTH